ncbi:alpha/beta hydrolase [Hyphomicrobium sp.]|uniref:alpha/beta hydrolase n=1 Tax=Hyphomicrobium sp. TaxID=82 RepID=UPI001D218D58|nr:alpha/beta hydrolase [Hyphomicrobium sp.]MBY0558660.1 alpha/beta hydrolase [Hyphomicrobium sp.]
MIWVAEGWRRPVRRTGLGLTILAACGLLAACSEAPKVGKDRAEPPSQAQESAQPPPPPVANAPAAPEAAPPPEAKQQSEDMGGSRDSDSQTDAYKKDEAEPGSSSTFEHEANGGSGPKIPSVIGEGRIGAGAPSPSAEEPKESAPPTEVEPKAVGAAPPPPPEPSEPAGGAAPPEPPAASAEAPAPKPRASYAQPPAPSAAMPAPPPPPAPAAVVPPPAAPSAAARAAIESDPSKKFKVVPVFYGTDRAIEPDPARLQFGSERGHKLQLGRALISVPLSHKVPHIERPTVYEIPYFKYKIYEEKEDPNKHFTLQEIKSLTEEQMLALVKEQLAKSSTFKDHAFVFVHGFNTSFDCALYRTAQITYDLGFDGVPFVYSWPSGGKVASYTYDRGSVEQAEPRLAEFLTMVIQKSGAKSISLIAHSMGNELLLRVLERLKPKIPNGVVISQVILAAPDVDRDKFNIIAREISSFARGVTLYAASNDRALGYSARFWGGVPRAGDIPKDGPLIIPGVDTIDVTAVSTDALGLNHSGYAENPALLDDVKALVSLGIRPPDKRLKSILAVESAAGTFWRFQATN